MKQDRIAKLGMAAKPGMHVWRAAAASLRGFIEGGTAIECARRMYPEDEVTPLILRAASTQATITDAAWAAPLAHVAVSDAIEDIVAMSAIGKLISAGALRVDMGRIAQVTVPGRLLDPTQAKNMWVAEGAAAPVQQYNLLGPTLGVHKCEVNVVVTRELSEASNVENVLRTLLTENAGLALDAAVFSTDAGSASKSAGILNGLTPLTPIAAGGIGFDACGQDLGELTQDIANRGGGRTIGFISAAKQSISIRFWAGGQFGLTPETDVLPVAASAVIPAGMVIGIEPQSFACSFGTPEFTVSKVAAVQMDNAPSGPGLIPGGVGGVKSMWQIDAMVIKMTLWGDFCMRAPHVSYMTGVSW